MAIKEHKAQSARRVRGEPLEPVTVKVRIYVKTEAGTDALLEFLAANGGDAEVHVFRSTEHWWAGQLRITRLDAGLIEPIAEMEGVATMSIIPPVLGMSNRLQRQEPKVVPTLTAAQITHADQWRWAGFTGSGVGVGVIDSSFQGFGLGSCRCCLVRTMVTTGRRMTVSRTP